MTKIISKLLTEYERSSRLASENTDYQQEKINLATQLVQAYIEDLKVRIARRETCNEPLADISACLQIVADNNLALRRLCHFHFGNYLWSRAALLGNYLFVRGYEGYYPQYTALISDAVAHFKQVVDAGDEAQFNDEQLASFRRSLDDMAICYEKIIRKKYPPEVRRKAEDDYYRAQAPLAEFEILTRRQSEDRLLSLYSYYDAQGKKLAESKKVEKRLDHAKKAHYYIQLAAQRQPSPTNKLLQVIATRHLGKNYEAVGDIEQALYYLKESITLNNALGLAQDALSHYEANKILGLIYLRLARNEGDLLRKSEYAKYSYEHFLQSLKTAASENNKEKQLEVALEALSLYSQCLEKSEDTEKIQELIKLYETAIIDLQKLAAKPLVFCHFFHTYNHLGSIHFRLGNYHAAIRSFEDAREIYGKHSPPRVTYHNYYSVIHQLALACALHAFDLIHKKVSAPGSSPSTYLNKALENSMKIDDPRKTALYTFYLGRHRVIRQYPNIAGTARYLINGIRDLQMNFANAGGYTGENEKRQVDFLRIKALVDGDRASHLTASDFYLLIAFGEDILTENSIAFSQEKYSTAPEGSDYLSSRHFSSTSAAAVNSDSQMTAVKRRASDRYDSSPDPRRGYGSYWDKRGPEDCMRFMSKRDNRSHHNDEQKKDETESRQSEYEQGFGPFRHKHFK